MKMGIEMTISQAGLVQITAKISDIGLERYDPRKRVSPTTSVSLLIFFPSYSYEGTFIYHLL